jgi:hypothetical protein
MRRVQVDLHALSFVGGGVVNGTTDERQWAHATTETRSRCDGDFNNDGRLDLATSNYDQTTGDGTLSVLLGNGDGSSRAAAHGGVIHTAKAVAASKTHVGCSSCILSTYSA